MTWFEAQICVTEACDFSIMSDGLVLFLSQTFTSMRLTGLDPDEVTLRLPVQTLTSHSKWLLSEVTLF